MSLYRPILKEGELFKRRKKWPRTLQKRLFRLYQGRLVYLSWSAESQSYEIKGFVKLKSDTRAHMIVPPQKRHTDLAKKGSMKGASSDRDNANHNEGQSEISQHSKQANNNQRCEFTVHTSSKSKKDGAQKQIILVLAASSAEEACSWITQINDARRMDSSGRIVFIGASEVGKTFIIKQLRTIYAETSGYEQRTAEERTRLYKLPLQIALIMFTKILCLQAKEFGISFDTRERMLESQYMCDLDPHEVYSTNSEIVGQKVWNVLRDLWKDSGIQQTFMRRTEFSLPDYSLYLFSQVDRICSSTFVPTVDDVLHDYLKTTQATSDWIIINTREYKVVDVGGRAGERRKWSSAIKKSNTYVFVAALSHYNESAPDDPETNRLQDSLNLFDKVCNSYFMKEADLFLILNKVDILKDKLRNSPLNEFFAEYEGPSDDFHEAVQFLKESFLSIAESTNLPHLKRDVFEKRIFTLSAEDRRSVQLIFEERVIDAMLHGGQSLERSSVRIDDLYNNRVTADGEGGGGGGDSDTDDSWQDSAETGTRSSSTSVLAEES